jgi:hypothetical protein
MDTERTRYREWSPWPTFTTVILWIIVPIAVYAVVTDTTEIPSDLLRWTVAFAVIALTWAIWAFLGGLTVLVQETRIVIHLGRTALVRKVVAFDDIAAMRVITYRPLIEFGGWGVRGTGNRRAWTARGNRAVEITTNDGNELLVGSDHPARLEERVRTLSGRDIGRNAAR